MMRNSQYIRMYDRDSLRNMHNQLNNISDDTRYVKGTILLLLVFHTRQQQQQQLAAYQPKLKYIVTAMK